MENPVIHFEIFGRDAQALREFYGGVFGWQFGSVMGPANYALVQKDDCDRPGIAGGIGSCSSGEYAGHVTFYVKVADVGAALADIERRGGTKVSGPDQVPGGPLIAQFRDPEGHLIGLTEFAAA